MELNGYAVWKTSFIDDELRSEVSFTIMGYLNQHPFLFYDSLDKPLLTSGYEWGATCNKPYNM